MKKNSLKKWVRFFLMGIMLAGLISCVAYRSYYPDETYRGGDYYYGGTYFWAPFPFFYYWEDSHPHYYHRPPPRYDGPPLDRPGPRDHRPPSQGPRPRPLR